LIHEFVGVRIFVAERIAFSVPGFTVEQKLQSPPRSEERISFLEGIMAGLAKSGPGPFSSKGPGETKLLQLKELVIFTLDRNRAELR